MVLSHPNGNHKERPVGLIVAMGCCQVVLIPIRNQPDSLVREETEALSPLIEEAWEAEIVEHRS